MSTHWFHDHMFSFTAQNVYKGNAGMFNIYSGLDRGAEDIPSTERRASTCGCRAARASATGKSWGNLDYDVNLMLADKAWDRDGQLEFDIFDFDGFLGDVMTVNLCYKPFLEVEPRKYRFRILNASVSRFFKLALSDGSPIIQIANDGNLLPHAGRAHRARRTGHRRALRHRHRLLAVHDRARRCGWSTWPSTRTARRPSAISRSRRRSRGDSDDPCVGRFLEFRVEPAAVGARSQSRAGRAHPEPGSVEHSRRPRTRVRVRPRRQEHHVRSRSRRSTGRGASRPTAATC